MDISVVIATHNQKERLRLVLAGLRGQSFIETRFEIIVVDDGCTDGTVEMLKAMGEQMPLRVVSLSPNQGRCRARNQGVAAARSDLVLFLDGDALPHPDWLQHYWKGWEQHGPDGLLCGMKYSLPELEYLQDPQTGAVVAEGVPSVVRDYIRQHRQEMILTEAMIGADFDAIHGRARIGGYPFPELETLQEQIRDLFTQYPDSPIGWIGFFPHNGAIPRIAFEQVGGFDEEIPFSEGWELAYRLQQAGIKPFFVSQARTYHLYHYHGFSDPTQARKETLVRRQAVEHMATRNQDPRLRLIPFWMAGIWPDPFLPEEMVLTDLVEFHSRYQEISPVELREIEVLLHRHPLHDEEEAEVDHAEVH